LALSIVYHGLAIPTGLVVAAGNWMPSPVMTTLSPVFGLLSGGTAQVSIQLTAVTGSPLVDDVFVDPWGRG
ncbi:MAG TPA: hypothetical protein VG294_08170, partial [Solirubrobacteraceae bacterium]|nr:hypothetical protein [Solirubrobacteraceae bacterium]